MTETIIRHAVYDDVPRLVSYISAFHQASPYADIAFSPGATRTFVQGLIQRPTACVYIHEHGAIGAELTYARFSKVLMAQEVFWWAEKDGFALLRAFENWAQEKDAALISMANLEGAERLDKIYRKRGYFRAEHLYLKAL